MGLNGSPFQQGSSLECYSLLIGKEQGGLACHGTRSGFGVFWQNWDLDSPKMELRLFRLAINYAGNCVTIHVLDLSCAGPRGCHREEEVLPTMTFSTSFLVFNSCILPFIAEIWGKAVMYLGEYSEIYTLGRKVSIVILLSCNKCRMSFQFPFISILVLQLNK